MSFSVYEALRRLFRSSYRVEHGSELHQTFTESNRDREQAAGALGAAGDVVPNTLLAQWEILRQDVRYAARTMSRSRGFVTTVVLVTALGVGANTATFSVADAVLLRPLPFPDPNGLVRLCEGPKDGGGWGCMNELSPANFRDVTAAATRTRGWGAFTFAEGNLVGFGEPVRIGGTAVTANVFSVLGVRPMLGRVFDASAIERDEGSVVLSYGLWRSQFGGDPGVVGKTIRLDDTPRVIVGVMPAGFHFPMPNDQIWTPLILREDDYAERDNTYLQAIGRLAPGATFEQARAELAAIFAGLARDHPETNAETGFSFLRQRDFVLPRYRLMLLALCGASLSLLLLTLANLGNLLLVRAAGRERELAVRAALGAGSERLVRQMLTESVVLAVVGGAAGVLIATLAVPLLSHLVPGTLPLAQAPRVDLRALGIAGVFTALTGIGFGLIPAAMVGRTGFRALRDGTRAGGGRRQRLRTVLVTVEVAVSVVLLVASGLLIRAVWKVQGVDPGFASERVLTLRTALVASRSADSVRRTEFYDRVLAGVQSLPGVSSAAYTSGLPMVLTGGIAGVEIPGAEVRNRRTDGVSLRYVTPQFFRTLGIPVLQGRSVDDGDRMGRPRVAVVSESFVRQYWPNENPIGKTFKVRGLEPAVVGVVRDIKVRGLERTNEPQLYMSAAQAPAQLGGLYIPKDLILRASVQVETLLPAVRDVIRHVDPEQPVSHVRLMSDVVSEQTADRRAQLHILSALAAVALLLTGVGIHGLLAFMVAQRTREIGVRLALGAEPGRVARMIVGEAARLALFGGIPGIIAAYAAARAMRALLFGIPPGDLITLASGTVLVILVTLAGGLAPAFRAVRVSPLVAMHAD
ncbi:MAG TPA: ABC transporter permease [Gemmatimonadaceae bacterium]|nr:ABC transporter permease [Gemmatimonadaceae bacterium]